jgi:hypothetical protein
MGTTLTALQSDEGVTTQWVLAIEGFEYLLTDGDTAAAATAWAATEWTQALPGLHVLGGYEQKLKPWDPAFNVSQMSFGVLPTGTADADDIVGRLAFGSGAGTMTFLAGELDCFEATIPATSTAQFGASGTIHIGTEQIPYSSRDTTLGASSFTASDRGKFAPFKAASESNQRFARAHRVPAIGDGHKIPSRIVSQQRTWPGRWVGLWIHRVVGGVLDTRAQAQLVWAGRIMEVRDDDQTGMTVFDCDDVKGALRDTILLADQWTARVKEGVYLRAGWSFNYVDWDGSTSGSALSLDVVDSGATPPTRSTRAHQDRRACGRRSTTGCRRRRSPGDIVFDISYSPRYDDPQGGGARGAFFVSGGSAAATTTSICTVRRTLLEMMGFGPSTTSSPTGPAPPIDGREPGGAVPHVHLGGELGALRGRRGERAGHVLRQLVLVPARGARHGDRRR